MSDSDTNHLNVLMEQALDQNGTILEYVSDVPKVLARLDTIEHDVAELKQDMKVVKAAVTSLSRQVNDQDRWITRLEAA